MLFLPPLILVLCSVILSFQYVAAFIFTCVYINLMQIIIYVFSIMAHYLVIGANSDCVVSVLTFI